MARPDDLHESKSLDLSHEEVARTDLQISLFDGWLLFLKLLDSRPEAAVHASEEALSTPSGGRRRDLCCQSRACPSRHHDDNHDGDHHLQPPHDHNLRKFQGFQEISGTTGLERGNDKVIGRALQS